MLRGIQEGRFQRRERPGSFQPGSLSPAPSSRQDATEGEEKILKFFSEELKVAFRLPSDQTLFVKIAIAEGIESSWHFRDNTACC